MFLHNFSIFQLDPLTVTLAKQLYNASTSQKTRLCLERPAAEATQGWTNLSFHVDTTQAHKVKVSSPIAVLILLNFPNGLTKNLCAGENQSVLFQLCWRRGGYNTAERRMLMKLGSWGAGGGRGWWVWGGRQVWGWEWRWKMMSWWRMQHRSADANEDDQQDEDVRLMKLMKMWGWWVSGGWIEPLTSPCNGPLRVP